MKPARRRTVSRAQVERAFRGTQKRRRPPDPENGSARGLRALVKRQYTSKPSITPASEVRDEPPLPRLWQSL